MERKKRCKDCEELKELSEFYEHPGMKDGHLNTCKDCKRSYARKHDEKVRAERKRKRQNRSLNGGV